MDAVKRSTTKAILWTALGFVMMTGVGFVFTGSLTTGGWMALANSALGMASYLLYERIWDRISWGRHAKD